MTLFLTPTIANHFLSGE